ncbi:hypothetical protein MOUN0_N11298 [Monosporozyma unispora]
MAKRALTVTQLNSVLKSFISHYPENFADKAWDNTGLLINCSIPDESATAITRPKVLLTVDLTNAVAKEAIDNECNLVIAYHPFIFPSWKFLDPIRNTQHKSAIQLIQNYISVYSPHTAMDAAKGGINDWMALGLVKNEFTAIDKIVTIEKIDAAPQDDSIGYGRVVTLKAPTNLATIITNIKQSLGINSLQIASPFGEPSHYSNVKTVALCAGSGSGVFKSLHNWDDIDVFYTGEMSHHELLKMKEMGKTCIVCNHTNTERGYLKDVLAGKFASEGYECIISQADQDPLRVV